MTILTAVTDLIASKRQYGTVVEGEQQQQLLQVDHRCKLLKIRFMKTNEIMEKLTLRIPITLSAWFHPIASLLLLSAYLARLRNSFSLLRRWDNAALLGG